MHTIAAALIALAVMFVVVPAAAAPAHAPPAAERGEAWVPLFDGKTLDGWRQVNGTAKYAVDGDAILGTTAEGSPNSFLCTEKLYADFELEFEVKVDPRLNSGVQFRSNSFPEYRRGRVHGYQAEIATGGTAGRIYDEARRARWLDKDRNDPAARQAFKDDGWNAYRILCRGDSIKTWVNGVPIVTDLADSLTKSGFIGLQVHSFTETPPAQVRWRNLRIREFKTADAPPSPERAKMQAIIDRVEKSCTERSVPMIGRLKAERLAELVRRACPEHVVECGTAVGYSGLWIARELKAAGRGRLTTFEIDPARAREAEGYFKEAGLGDIVTVRIGDASALVKEIAGKVDFAFIDCGYENYYPCFLGLEPRLVDGAVVVADNAGIGAAGMAEYLTAMRTKHESRTEWFDVNLPWVKRDAIEVTIVRVGQER